MHFYRDVCRWYAYPLYLCFSGTQSIIFTRISFCLSHGRWFISQHSVCRSTEVSEKHSVHKCMVRFLGLWIAIDNYYEESQETFAYLFMS